MPVQVRKIDWSLLVNPSMAGIRIEADADARKHATISGAFNNVGARRESKRRADREFSLRKRSVDLREEQIKEDRLARQAFDSQLLDDVQQAGAAVAQSGGNDPEASQRLIQLTQAAGGAAAAGAKIVNRAAGVAPQQVDDNNKPCGGPGQDP